MAAAPQQYLFISHRNIVITSTLGYSIEFLKGKPVHVPRAMHQAVMEKGCVPCDAQGNQLDAPAVSAMAEAAEDKTVRPDAPEDSEERADAIERACKAIFEKNSSRDFSAGGVPSATAVSQRLGWNVDAKEINPVWRRIKPALIGSKAAE